MIQISSTRQLKSHFQLSPATQASGQTHNSQVNPNCQGKSITS